jgi:Uncharacterized protein conserved in bacteria
MEKNMGISLLLDFYGEILPERQREVLDMYYNDDYSLSEISEIVAISRQGVRSAIKKGEDTLSELENKLKLLERFTEVKSQSEKIAAVLEKVADKLNEDNNAAYDDVKSIINEIKILSE